MADDKAGAVEEAGRVFSLMADDNAVAVLLSQTLGRKPCNDIGADHCMLAHLGHEVAAGPPRVQIGLCLGQLEGHCDPSRVDHREHVLDDSPVGRRGYAPRLCPSGEAVCCIDGKPSAFGALRLKCRCVGLHSLVYSRWASAPRMWSSGGTSAVAGACCRLRPAAPGSPG